MNRGIGERENGRMGDASAIFESRITNHESRITSPAFTLVELLAVMAIILLLAGMIIGIGSYMSRKSLESKARSQLHQLNLALELYKNDWGAFPVTLYDWPRAFAISHVYYGSAPYTSPPSNMYMSNSLALYQQLTSYSGVNGPPSAPPVKNYYQELRGEQVQSVTIGGTSFKVLIDPYGNPWGYLNTASNTNQFNVRSYDLWSFGLNSSDPTNALICNWRQ